MSQCYICANLVEIGRPVHEIWFTQALFGLNLAVLSPAMTLKIRSRSPKPNQLFVMSQCYIHANLVKIYLPVHEISRIQESVTPTLTGSAPKTMSPSPSMGDINTRMHAHLILSWRPCSRNLGYYDNLKYCAKILATKIATCIQTHNCTAHGKSRKLA